MLSSKDRRKLVRTLRWLAVGFVVAGAGSILSRTQQPLPNTAYSSTQLTIAYLSVLLLAAASVWGSRSISLDKAVVKAVMPDMPPPAPAPAEVLAPDDAGLPADGILPGELAADPFVARVRSVLEGSPEYLANSPLRRSDDQFELFAIRTTRPGGFANPKRIEQIFQMITSSVDGQWLLMPKPQDDVLLFERKAGFPSLITPPIPSHIPQTAREALENYSRFRLKLGVDSSGTILTVDPARFPHAVVVGGTGSGKSVFNRGVIEDYRTAGWMILLGDGKGTDFEGLQRMPGMVAVSQNTRDHVRLVRMAADELRARQYEAQNLKRKGDAQPFRRPPMLLLLDEYASMKNNIAGEYGDVKSFERDLLFLIRVGREFKVHVILSTQELYRNTIPGTIMGNISVIVSLGPPADKTIKEAFPDMLRDGAKRIGDTITKDDMGRGMALFSGDDGTPRVVEFQSYYAYSPAESKPAPTPLVAAEWVSYKEQASDRLPKLYPRAWFKVEDPNYGKELAELYALEQTLIDGIDGNPDPAKSQWDPLSDDYNGRDDENQGSALPSLDEIPDYRPPPAQPAPVAASNSTECEDAGEGPPPSSDEDEIPFAGEAEDCEGEDDFVEIADPPTSEPNPGEPSRPLIRRRNVGANL